MRYAQYIFPQATFPLQLFVQPSKPWLGPETYKQQVSRQHTPRNGKKINPKRAFKPTPSDREGLKPADDTTPVAVTRQGDPVYRSDIAARARLRRMFELVQYSTLSGKDLEARIKNDLGLTLEQFGCRMGIATRAVEVMVRRKAGQVPLMWQRLVEFEEFMQGVAHVIDRSSPKDQSRAALEQLLDEQIDRTA